MESLTSYSVEFFARFWHTVLEMAPYLLFGFFVAGLLSVFVRPELVERHLGGRRIWPLIKASVFGVPLPLCSCGVIPVAMSLHKHGASKGATVAFLLSTPQTGVDSIFVTYSLLGPVFAVFRPFIALITGIVGGGLVNLIGAREPEAEVSMRCEEACCGEGQVTFRTGMRYGFVTLPRDIGKELIVGLLIAAVISAFVPDGFFAEYLGVGLLPMVLMLFLGIPVYVCATASVPVAAAMIMKGLTPGAALVFLMTGPATNAASFVTIWKVLGHKTALTYLFSVAGCALIAGVLLDFIAFETILKAVEQPGWELPEIIKFVAAIAFFIVLGFAILKKPKRHEVHDENGSSGGSETGSCS